MEAEGSPFRSWTADVKGAVAEEVMINNNAGWAYLKALPISRRKRKQLMTAPWIVNLFAGPSDGTAEFKVLEDGAVMIEMDIVRSRAFDLRRPSGAYRALLWAAATGRIKGMMASPPVRNEMDEELVAKAMWCSVVAKASRSLYGDPPPFLMFEGYKMLNYMNNGMGWTRPTGLQRSWSAYQEVMCLDSIGNSVVTNLEYNGDAVKESTLEGKWTKEFKQEILQAIEKWFAVPEGRQIAKWMAKMDVGSFLNSLSNKELEQWKVHVRNNHLPYRRDCRTCVETSGTGRRHVRVRTPSSYCLSLDVCGPFRQRGVDPDHADYRFALVGAYVMPRLYEHEVRDGGPHKGEVRDGGPHKGEVRDGGPHKGEVRDGGPHKGEVRDGGPEGIECGLSDRTVPIYGGEFEPDVAEDTGHGVGPLRDWREEELFDEAEPQGLSPEEERRLPKGMTKEEFQEIFSQVDGVDGYQVIYLASPLRSRTTKDVLSAVQDLYLRLRAHGCPVLRVHSDRARELRSEPLKRWLAGRGTYTTYTEGQSPQSNGRAESAVRFAKSHVKRLLKMANLDGRLWPMALQYSMWSQMQKQLYPNKEVIPFGTRVHVKRKVYGVGNKYDLESRWDIGYYLGPSRDVNEGSVVMMKKGNFITTTYMRPGLVNADKEVELEDYHAVVATPSNRLRRKSTLQPGDHEGLPALPPVNEDEEEEGGTEYDPNDPVEEYARAVLKEDRIERDFVESLAALAALLPEDGPKPKRFGGKENDEVIWATGAFVHGGVVGVSEQHQEIPPRPPRSS